MTATLMSSKRAMLHLSHAMEDVLAEVAGPDCLVVALFQRRAYFEVEAARYAELAARGTCVVVAFTGIHDGLPDGVVGVELDEDDSMSSRWDLVVLAPGLGMALLTVDQYALAVGEQSLEAARMFAGSWTFQPAVAATAAAERITTFADRLEPAVVAAATTIIATARQRTQDPALEHAATITEQLLQRIDQAHQRDRSTSSALDNALRAAETDALTGLRNRHHLDRYLGTAPAESSARLMAVLVDLDDLKLINDTDGHDAGDAALVAVAEAIRSNVRDSDIACRFGGDEFLVLLPGMSPEAGLEVGQRIAAAAAASLMPEPWHTRRITVSVGVAPAEPAKLPIQALDAALYEVKRGGKGFAMLVNPAPNHLDVP